MPAQAGPVPSMVRGGHRVLYDSPGFPFAGMTNLALRIFMQYSGRFVIPFIVLGKSERILPAPFFSTQIPIIEVESGRVIEIDGGGRDKAQRPCSLAGFLEGFRPSLIKFSKEVAGWKRTDWARGRTGAGTPQHLVMERLPIKENIKWTHIPFQGGGAGDRRPPRGTCGGGLPNHRMEEARGDRDPETPGGVRGEPNGGLSQRPHPTGAGV